MKFTEKTIGEIERLIKTGKTPPSKKSEYYNGVINWYTPGDLDKEKYLSNSQRTVTKQAIKDKKVSMVPKNTVLIGAIGDIGKLGITSVESCSNQQITGLIPNEDVHFEYLYYWLKNNKWLLRKFATNAIVPILNNKALRSIKISYPKEIDDQKRIAKILSDCEALIQKRKDSIELLDELLKSTFLEMFGDPVRNEKGFDYDSIKNHIGKVITGNTPPRKDPRNYGHFIEWIKTDNIFPEDKFLHNAKEMLSEKGLEKGRFVEPGALLVTCIAGSLKSIGNSALANRKLAFNQQINAIVPNEDIDSEFLYWMMQVAKTYIQSSAKKGMKKILTKSEFENLKFIKPPKDEQIKFSLISKKSEEINTRLKTSLQELENLYGSISQRAFKGELNLEKVDISDMEDFTQEKPEMEPIGDPRWEGKVEVQDYQVHLDEIIKKDFENSSFSFKQLEDAIADRGVYVHYDNVKEFVFKSLEGDNSLLVQEMDEKEKQIVFKIR